MELNNLKRRVQQYKDIVENTTIYRQVWKDSLKTKIINQLTEIAKAIELNVVITVRQEMENLEAIMFSLGNQDSGLVHEEEGKPALPLKKHNGSLIYQQLFNGKVVVMLQFPAIQGYGEPLPARQVGIYRPEELTEAFFVKHIDEFLKEVTNWEDYDDDDNPSSHKIGFRVNFEGEK